MTTTEETKAGSVTGLVLYTDGSARPTNPGFGGSGIHGYKYTTEESKKGTGLSTHFITDKGYIRKPAGGQKVTLTDSVAVVPVEYFDGIIVFDENLISNNVAELRAMTVALEFASMEPGITKLTILADSEYAIKSANEWVFKWRDMGWKKPTGEYPANLSYLTALLAAREACTAKGIDISISWVEAHVGELGNTVADALAGIGASYSRYQNKTNSVIMDRVPADGYWKYNADRHPFISQSFLYFDTIPEHNKPGEYCLGNQGKEIDLFGKKVPDGGFAFIKIAQPDTVLEDIRNFQFELAEGGSALVCAKLDAIYSSTNHQLISKHGKHALYKSSTKRLDLLCPDNEPGVREFWPPKIALRSMDALNAMVNILEKYSDCPGTYIVTDITSEFYHRKEVVKKNKEPSIEVVLKPEFVVGFPGFHVNVQHQSGSDIATSQVMLTFGIDCPGRNALKRLETSDPKVEVVTWLESEKAFRHAVVIHAGQDKGIWCGYYSNLKLF